MTPPRHAAIEAAGLRKVFPDGTVAVHDVSFVVEHGEVVALLGPNGAGKTTSLHMLLGLLPPSAGRALVEGVDVHRFPRRVYARVGYMSENVRPYGALTARQNLRFFGRVSGTRVPAAHVTALLARVGLAHAADRPVHAFSKGMRQRLGLAIALVKDPPVLVLDEPTTGLDPEGVDALLRLVRELRDEGKAVLFSTHDLHRVAEVADRLVVLGGGRVRGVAEPSEVDASPGGLVAYYRALTREEAELA